MKKKIAVLGSTGSIGKNLLSIIKKNPKKYQVLLLSANKNYKELLSQAKIFNVKNLVITDQNIYKKIKDKKIFNNINLFQNFSCFSKIFNKKKN